MGLLGVVCIVIEIQLLNSIVFSSSNRFRRNLTTKAMYSMRSEKVFLAYINNSVYCECKNNRNVAWTRMILFIRLNAVRFFGIVDGDGDERPKRKENRKKRMYARKLYVIKNA